MRVGPVWATDPRPLGSFSPMTAAVGCGTGSNPESLVQIGGPLWTVRKQPLSLPIRGQPSIEVVGTNGPRYLLEARISRGYPGRLTSRWEPSPWFRSRAGASLNDLAR